MQGEERDWERNPTKDRKEEQMPGGPAEAEISEPNFMLLKKALFFVKSKLTIKQWRLTGIYRKLIWNLAHFDLTKIF